jgi:hypothetical protein
MRGTGHHAAALREHAWLIALLAVYTAGVFVTAAAFGRFPGSLAAPIGYIVFSGSILALALAAACVRAALGDRQRPLRAVMVWGRAWTREHGPAALISCPALPALMTVFLLGKTLIPLIHPFSWDVALADLDRQLHGGTPWELLQPVLGHPAITQGLSRIYTFWFTLPVSAWIIWSLSSHPERMRFLISFTLCWVVLGTLAATVFSSAGPVFYAEVTGDGDTFGGLMRYLRDVDRQSPLLNLAIRDSLWHAYVGGADGIVSGISAMPSLHVAMVTLCAISGWHISRMVGMLLTLFAAVIFVGSIHLGWHYAVDGYVSALAVAGIWYGVGWLLNRRRGGAALLGSAAPACIPGVIRAGRVVNRW